MIRQDYVAVIIGAGQVGPALAGRLDHAGMHVGIVERACSGGSRGFEQARGVRGLPASLAARHSPISSRRRGSGRCRRRHLGHARGTADALQADFFCRALVVANGAMAASIGGPVVRTFHRLGTANGDVLAPSPFIRSVRLASGICRMTARARSALPNQCSSWRSVKRSRRTVSGVTL